MDRRREDSPLNSQGAPAGTQRADASRLPSMLTGFVLVIAVLLGSAGLDIWNTQRLEEDTAWVAHTHEVLDLTTNVLRMLVDAETATRGFLITGKDEHLQPYDATEQHLGGVLRTLQEKTADNPGQQEQITRLTAMAGVRMSLLAKGIELRRSSFDAAQAHVASGAGKAQMDAIRQLGPISW